MSLDKPFYWLINPMKESLLYHSYDFIKRESFNLYKNKKIIMLTCDFDASQYRLQLSKELNLLIPEEINRCVNKRKAEFIAGRYLAKKALKKLGIENDLIPISASRGPIWPKNVVGSISHNASKALCAVSFSVNNSYIGVDVESYIDKPMVESLEAMIVSKDEKKVLKKLNLPPNLGLTLAFSAKESLFKAINPHTGLYFGFEHARILTVSLKNKTITLELDSHFVPAASNTKKYLCEFQLNKQFVQTFVAGKF